MAGVEMRVLLQSIMNQLQAPDMEELKYILKDSFTGECYLLLELLSFQQAKCLKRKK